MDGKLSNKDYFKVINRVNFYLNSNVERKEIYLQSIDLIKKKKLFGYGQLNFAYLSKSEFKDQIMFNRGNAESQFLQLLLENGIFGFFAYFLIISENNITLYLPVNLLQLKSFGLVDHATHDHKPLIVT